MMGGGREITVLMTLGLIGFAVSLPFAIWKLVEIVIWFFSHLSWS